MPSQFSGGCACGAIRYECTSEPVYMGNCHCRDCQRATGSAYLAVIVVRESGFTQLQGDPSWYESQSDSGHAMRRAFCGKCGSPVFIKNGSSPKARVLYAGGLDDPSWYKPSRDIYVASAQPWDVMDPALPKDHQMPSW